MILENKLLPFQPLKYNTNFDYVLFSTMLPILCSIFRALCFLTALIESTNQHFVIYADVRLLRLRTIVNCWEEFVCLSRLWNEWWLWANIFFAICNTKLINYSCLGRVLDILIYLTVIFALFNIIRAWRCF